MPTISLCMIVKNEEEVLEQCLNSVFRICDEIIVVDTGSTDRTKEIARQFTHKVLDFTWIDHFSAARNYSFEQATQDYILWLDADDWVKEEDQQKLMDLKNTLDDSIDAVSMKYHIAFDENGNPTFTYRRHRLVKRKNHFRWIGAVHEYLEVGGNILASDIAITHCKKAKKPSGPNHRNLEIYEKMIKNGVEFTPRDLYYYANELKDHRNFKKAAIYYREFIQTGKGWVEDVICAHGYLSFCLEQIGEKEKHVEALLHTFKYDVPRPEYSCRIGDYFLAKKEFKKAAFWYQLATEVKMEDTGGFVNLSYSTWYPHLQLCVCYWELGEYEKAVEQNELAGKFQPNHASVQYNRRFFEDYRKKQG